MDPILLSLIKIGLILFVILTAAAYTVYLERKVCAWIQQRYGPNRVGPFGLLQPLADVIKLILKEDIVPVRGDRIVHYISPIISVTIAIAAFGLIPFASNLVIADVNIGVLYILAITSIGVYGITLAGWSSNSKYALLGGLRSSAQMISYELSMGLSVVGVIILTNMLADEGTGFLSLTSIVEAQHEFTWFAVMNPIGFFIFVTCAFAETNRAPFDLVEAEQELVGGFHTEYSSMKFALFFLAEYINMIIASMVITTLFCGGYLAPFFEETVRESALWNDSIWFQMAWGIGWFSAKTLFWVFVFIWIRWTLPRFKYNQLMNIGWKSFLPVSIANLLFVGLLAFILMQYVFN